MEKIEKNSMKIDFHNKLKQPNLQSHISETAIATGVVLARLILCSFSRII